MNIFNGGCNSFDMFSYESPGSHGDLNLLPGGSGVATRCKCEAEGRVVLPGKTSQETANPTGKY